jgi:hypothetical protein
MISEERMTNLGIQQSQVKSSRVLQNVGWYNSTGEKLGWGDLNKDDILAIQQSLQPGELFVALSERDVKPEEKNSGIKYLAKNALLIISNTQFFSVQSRIDDGISLLSYDRALLLLESGK